MNISGIFNLKIPLLIFLVGVFLSANIHASLNSKFVYSQKLGSHIETVLGKTKLKSSYKTPDGYTFAFGGYINGSHKIFKRSLFVFKDDYLVMLALYGDNSSDKFISLEQRNKWTFDFYKGLKQNLYDNYQSDFANLFDSQYTINANICENPYFFEKCNDSFYIEGKKKGIGIYIFDSEEVGLVYFDTNMSYDFKYEDFLGMARRQLQVIISGEIAIEKSKSFGTQDKLAIRNLEDPSISEAIKLD